MNKKTSKQTKEDIVFGTIKRKLNQIANINDLTKDYSVLVAITDNSGKINYYRTNYPYGNYDEEIAGDIPVEFEKCTVSIVEGTRKFETNGLRAAANKNELATKYQKFKIINVNNNRMEIKTTSEWSKHEYKVYNSAGNKAASGIVGENGKIELGLGSFNNGVYTVKIEPDIWKQNIFINKIDFDSLSVEPLKLAQKYAPILAYPDVEEYYPAPLGYLAPHEKDGIDEDSYPDVKNLEEEEFNIRSNRLKDKQVITSKLPYLGLGEYLANNGSEDFYIDFNYGQTHKSFLDDLSLLAKITGSLDSATIYYSFIKRDGKYYLNYHFFYPFDPKQGTSDKPDKAAHVYDRESMSLVFDDLNSEPESIVFGAHLDSQLMALFDEKLEREIVWENNDKVEEGGRVKIPWVEAFKYKYNNEQIHPIVSIAKGSHALYPVPGYYHCNVNPAGRGHSPIATNEVAGDSLMGNTLFKVNEKGMDNKWERVLFPKQYKDKMVTKENEDKVYQLKFLNLGQLTSSSENAPLLFSGAWVDVMYDPTHPFATNAKFPPFTEREKNISEWTSDAYSGRNGLSFMELIPDYSKELMKLLDVHVNINLDKVDIFKQPEKKLVKDRTVRLSEEFKDAAMYETTAGEKEVEIAKKLTPSKARTIKYLDASNSAIIEGLEGLQYFTELEKLNLGNWHNEDGNLLNTQGRLIKDWGGEAVNSNIINNLGPIANLITLKELNLSNTGIEDLNKLFDLEAPRGLDYYKPEYKGLLKFMPNHDVTEVDLNTKQESIAVDKVNALSNLISLEKLNLSLNKINDLSIIKKSINSGALKNLKELNLSDNKNQDGETTLTDITPLKSLTKLEDFQLLDLRANNLDLEEGSATMETINYLKNEGIRVLYDGQKIIPWSHIDTNFDTKWKERGVPVIFLTDFTFKATEKTSNQQLDQFLDNLVHGTDKADGIVKGDRLTVNDIALYGLTINAENKEDGAKLLAEQLSQDQRNMQ
ncbi:leucine-rich repeat domain-containing protein [Halanaerobacter jeridensis]|uniref:Leucine rich repeat (LRR) protein n=1 Tax=Halanaerobacter jeridensis TaxID=706427 RepID=A0A938XVB1_9FIRM|nr:hypothetical protein [Halanaerobacter jeridensis]MBM7558190.1 hypothetical protein [Halanaerobacter jeridensis]